ncbi:MAG: hypothetical protein AAFX06_20815 [Planctomycetota bacterium]
MILLLTWFCGCASPQKQVVEKDATLHRSANAAGDAFREGNLKQARKDYIDSLLRAWAIDDPYESGTLAYNLAACAVAEDDLEQAKQWLCDARVELGRAGASAGNTWLLSASIALSEDRVADADRFLGYASCANPPCETIGPSCNAGLCSSCEALDCESCCLSGLPFIGADACDCEQVQQCQESYRVRVLLAKARLAVRICDLENAQALLREACQMTEGICDLSLRADFHDVAAAIHDLQECHVLAAAHRDHEVKLLRCVGQYREIPNVLDAAAESFLEAGKPDAALERITRSARIHLARGDLNEAWRRVDAASELAVLVGCEAAETRLAITARLIQQRLAPGVLPEGLDDSDPAEPRRDSTESSRSSALPPGS